MHIVEKSLVFLFNARRTVARFTQHDNYSNILKSLEVQLEGSVRDKFVSIKSSVVLNV